METQDISTSGPGESRFELTESATSNGFHQVFVFLDRSEAAETALPLASHIAAIDGARMTLLHVVETPPDGRYVRVTDALEWEIVRREARGYLSQVAETLEDLGITAEIEVAEGGLGHGNAAFGPRPESALLVLFVPREGGIGTWSLGGTADRMLAEAQGAILLVPAGAGQLASHPPLARILVPLDGSLRGESVLPTVLRLARADNAEIVVTHAVPDPIRTEVLSTPEDLALADTLADRMAARADAYLERICAQLRAGGVRAKAVVCRTADHREGLVGLAAAERADLVVVSAHGVVCNPDRPFGSVTSHMIACSPSPVLVLQDRPARSRLESTAPASRLPSRSLDASVESA